MLNMKTFWGVTTYYECYGIITVKNPFSIEDTEMPDNVYESTNNYDVYINWFESLEEAQHFAEEEKKHIKF